MSDLIERFRADCDIRKIRSITTYTAYVIQFEAFLMSRGKDLLHVDREDLKNFLLFLQKKEVKQGSIDRIFTCISSLYTFLVDEELIASNPITPFRRRYLRRYKNDNGSEARQIISVEQASLLVNSILDSRDKAIVALLLKTGMRRGELNQLDIDDIDLENQTIRLKPTAKRSNRLLFFDYETEDVLRIWLNARGTRNRKGVKALFPGRQGRHLNSAEIDYIVKKHAARVGLHNPSSKRLDDRFTPHCCRHWFTTHLRRAGMPREFIQELRGDVRREAIDIYDHIDKKELRESYLAHIPQLGI